MLHPEARALLNHDHFIDDARHDLDWRASPLLHHDRSRLPPAFAGGGESAGCGRCHRAGQEAGFIGATVHWNSSCNVA